MRLFSALLTSASKKADPPSDLRLFGQHLVLRPGVPSDWGSWRALREASRNFLKPFEPDWPSNSLSYSFFTGILRRQRRDWREDKGYAFLIFRERQDHGKERGEGPLVGGIGLSDIERGAAQKATLGYWIGLPYARQGIMTAAVRMVCDFGFQKLNLHRIEASCLPGNEPSRRLLRNLDFAEEGYAKSYLRINGAWQDHILLGKIASLPPR